MGKNIDLTGKKYGKLTVLRKSDKKGKNSYWICRCDCGVEKEICATALKHGQKSCGCAAFDFIEEKRIRNEYTVDENNVVHVVLRTGDEMLCDLDDWEELKRLTWTKDAHGYATTCDRGKRKKFHIEVKGKKEGYVIDHADRNKLNNQKCNLRFLTSKGNAMNMSLSKNNTSGITGVCKNRSGKRWVARLYIDGKNLYFGTYDTKEEAGIARKNAEEKYFKPFLQEQ